MMINKLSIPFMLLTGALFYPPVFAQEVPTPQQALQNFGIDAAQIAELERGKIIAYEVSETSQKELAIGVAMILPVALPKIVDYIKLGKLTATEIDIIASAPLANADINSFKNFAFTDQQLDEAKAFLEAEPGDEFNLSKSEFDSLKSLQASLENADNKTLLAAANQKYREILLQRLLAYRKSGLSGIAAYSRENGNVDPAAELRNEAVNSKSWLRYFPELQQVWLNYPAALPPNTTEQFLWLNRKVDGRPTANLVHRLMVAGKGGGIVVSRQFYVGHSYNSSHSVAGGLPYKGGTLVFYTTHSFSDQVAGMGSSLKHSIGREQMKKVMIKRLQRLNKDLKRKAAMVGSGD
ncbi:MAG: hypothetical protein PHF31_03310 [Methylobacter sp.]|nr:hypothetical protein [Methylobacter sp.]